MALEVEAKFHAKDSTTAAEDVLAALLPAGVELGDVVRQELRDDYLDTPRRALVRSGYTLRVRTRGDRPDRPRTLTIKALERSDQGGDGQGGDDPIHARFELEAPLPADASPHDPSGYPDSVRRVLTEIAGAKARLKPILAIEQIRTLSDVRALLSETNELSERHSVVVGELSVDDATVISADGAVIASFREIEFERADDAPPEVFQHLVDALSKRDGLEAVGEGKLVRGLELAARHVPGRPPGEFDLRADMTVAEAGRLVWRKQLNAMLLTEAGARRGEDIEFVHDMRVATRRARAAWVHYGAGFDKRPMGRLLKGLKRTAGALGSVRDLDVALDALATYSRDAGPEDAASLEAVAERWREEREAAYVELLDWLDGKRYPRFIKRMVKHCNTPGANTASDRPAELVRHVLPGAVMDAFEVVRAYEPLFDAEERVPVETLHAMRIDCKRLRYAIEPLSHLMGSEGRAFVKTLKRLQDVLGDLNDASVAQARLGELQADGHDTPAVGRYLDRQAEIIENCRQAVDAVWRPFISPESTARLDASLRDW